MCDGRREQLKGGVDWGRGRGGGGWGGWEVGVLTKESLREAKGRYIQKGEQFFHIPYTEAELVKL